MNRSSAFLGWVAGGVGIILIYSAYRNQGPLSVVTKALGKDSATTTINSGSGGAIPTGVAAIPGVGQLANSRPLQLKEHQISPVYVPITSQPNLVLDKDAAASFAMVQAAYGKKIWLSGASRSYAEQVIAYQENPGLFGKPGTSLHEVGLAVDVDQKLMNVNDPALVAAFTNAGWFRRGKKLANGLPEPWHWSYGVPG